MASELQEGTTAPAGEHEAGGLPQFDMYWWPGEIAWFLIFFVIILVFMRVFAVPRIGGAIDEREEHISGQIAEARRMKDEADAQADAAGAETAQARQRAQKVASDARAKAQAEAEGRIAAMRDSAMGNVQAIAQDAAQAIVQQLTGKAASTAELSGVRG
jgi:F-type H+-transporting ATPase subunit b